MKVFERIQRRFRETAKLMGTTNVREVNGEPLTVMQGVRDKERAFDFGDMLTVLLQCWDAQIQRMLDGGLVSRPAPMWMEGHIKMLDWEYDLGLLVLDAPTRASREEWVVTMPSDDKTRFSSWMGDGPLTCIQPYRRFDRMPAEALAMVKAEHPEAPDPPHLTTFDRGTHVIRWGPGKPTSCTLNDTGNYQHFWLPSLGKHAELQDADVLAVLGGSTTIDCLNMEHNPASGMLRLKMSRRCFREKTLAWFGFQKMTQTCPLAAGHIVELTTESGTVAFWVPLGWHCPTNIDEIGKAIGKSKRRLPSSLRTNFAKEMLKQKGWKI